MGAIGRVLITGASGFIGRATVAAALKAGLEVVAVQRRSGTFGAPVTYVSADLTVQDSIPVLTQALLGCDAVIHLAAAMSGDAAAHTRLTLDGTQHLIRAMQAAGTPHLTLASSIAVFDSACIPIGGEMTDACPKVTAITARDTYSRAKAQQEALCTDAGLSSLCVLRPGIVYDATHLWNAHLGIGAGPVLFAATPGDVLPMCHTKRCAAALVQSVLHRVRGEVTVLDPDLPMRGRVIAALRRRGWPKLVLPLPTRGLWAMAHLLKPVAAGLPGLLRVPVLRHRLMPMTYRFTLPTGFALPDPPPVLEPSA